MDAIAKSSVPSLSDLSPNNVGTTLKKAKAAHEAAKQTATAAVNESQIQGKKTAYLQKYSGNVDAKQPYTYVDIIDVFATYVNYKTPDVSTSLKPQTPAGTAMDLSHVILGLKPALNKNIMDVPEIMLFMDKHDLNYKVVKDLSSAQLLIANTKLKMSDPLLAPEVSQVKPLLEKYRQPMLDAMFCFDDPSLCAVPAPAPAPAPKPKAAPAPAPNAAKTKSKEAFGAMSSDSTFWENISSTHFAVGLFAFAVFFLACWFLVNGFDKVGRLFRNRYVKWSRPTRTRRTRAHR